MRFWRLKKRRSAGIPVSAPVHRLLRAADAARGRDWNRAAIAYRSALDAMPDLAHIWVQLGHALGEQGDEQGAVAAYRRSIAAGGDAGEGHVHLGHAANRAGDWRSAIWHYGMAARHGRNDGLAAVADHAGRSIPVGRALLRSALIDYVATAQAPAETVNGEQAVDAEPAGHFVSYDVSDLIAHFRHYRLPTGIQRVQVEVLARALATAPRRTRICCFVRGRDDLIELPHSLFGTLEGLARIGGDGGDPAWLTAVARLSVHAMAAAPYQFTAGECLVNLGTSWATYNYFLTIRAAKISHGIRYIATVHDLIPVYAPQFCVSAITQDYTNWLIGAFAHVDQFLANSQSTARDLARAARQLGRHDAAVRIAVIPFDADFRSPEHGDDTGALAGHGLSVGGYALLVSTIEPRKNHLLVLQAWARLLRLYSFDRIPSLALVGRPGWLNERVYAYLNSDPLVAAKVVLIEQVSDGGLAELYKGCAFTVYPSLYEGWGLPVTEALCYGKVPIVANNSSLVEAGGDFAAFFDSGSLDDLMRVLEQVIFDTAWRSSRERDIAARFAPRTWQAIADAIIVEAEAAMRRVAIADPTAALPGRFYPFGLYRGLGLWPGLDSGERFRTGDGWFPPENGCCRMAPGRAALRFTPPRAGEWTIMLLLVAIDEGQCPFRLSVDDAVIEGSIDPGTMRWSRPLRITAGADRPIEMVLEAPYGERRAVQRDGVECCEMVAIGIAGLFFHASDDATAAARVMAAGLSGDVSAISTYSSSACLGSPPQSA